VIYNNSWYSAQPVGTRLLPGSAWSGCRYITKVTWRMATNRLSFDVQSIKVDDLYFVRVRVVGRRSLLGAHLMFWCRNHDQQLLPLHIPHSCPIDARAVRHCALTINAVSFTTFFVLAINLLSACIAAYTYKNSVEITSWLFPGH